MSFVQELLSAFGSVHIRNWASWVHGESYDCALYFVKPFGRFSLTSLDQSTSTGLWCVGTVFTQHGGASLKGCQGTLDHGEFIDSD